MSSKTAGLESLQELIDNVKRNKAGGSKATAQSIASIFSAIIKTGSWKDPKNLFKIINQMGRKLMEADPMAFYIGNIVKRVIHTIKIQCKALNIPLDEMNEQSEQQVNVVYDNYRIYQLH